MVIQVGIELIYMTTRAISAGEPLKVWYAPSYAKRINRPLTPDGNTKCEYSRQTERLYIMNVHIIMMIKINK